LFTTASAKPRTLTDFTTELLAKPEIKFYLGWDGLHINRSYKDDSGNIIDTIKLHIGDDSTNMINIANKGSSFFKVTNTGRVVVVGSVEATNGKIGGWYISTDGISNEERSVCFYPTSKEFFV
jgi:hypothetical protein